jgi:hypothetical protein
MRDVVAWKGDRLVFLESKLHKNDRIQDTQPRWMMSSLESGLTLANFIVVEWHLPNQAKAIFECNSTTSSSSVGTSE